MRNIVPSRITDARETRAMSMEELAEHIGVTRQSVSKYERGITNPSFEILQLISRTLDFQESFFYKTEDSDSAASSALFFRSNSTITKKVKVACKYQVKRADEIKKQLEQYVDFIPVELRTIDGNYEDLEEGDLEELALSIRKEWELDDEPIDDLIGILENRGILVVQMSSNEHCPFKGIDAFSEWKDGTPYILYHPTQKSAVRTRFSILHELGHLIMHSSITDEEATKKSVVDFADNQADRFAAAFLLPATSFPKDIHSSSLLAFNTVKKKWGTAFSTIIRRCETLNLLSDNQISYLKKQMTVNKYWRKEPLDDVLTVAEPEVIRDAIYMLIERRIIKKSSFLRESGLSASDVEHICGLPEDFFADVEERQKPALRLLVTER